MYSEEKLKEAIETYNKIASVYAKYTEDKLIQFQLARFESMLPGKKILDVGCGSGRDTLYFQEDGFDSIGIDLAEKMVEEAKKRAPDSKFKKMDFRKMAFKDSSFGGVWSVNSLVHTPREQIIPTLKEFHRVLSDKGIVYISVKRGEGEKEEFDEKYDNKSRTFVYFEMKEMQDYLEQAGFKIISAECNDVWVEIFAEKI